MKKRLDKRNTQSSKNHKQKHVGGEMKKQVKRWIGLAGILLFSGMLFAQTAPSGAAPTPTVHADSVVSLYSDAYTNEIIGTWSADWDVADVADTNVAGNATKLYTNLSYAGIEFTSPTIDLTSMKRFHMDIWTPDAVDGGQVFKVKLVDFGADGAYGGGDDVEHELTFSSSTSPALATGTWVSLDVSLNEFSGLVSKSHLAQMIISGDPNTVWVDNIYFYDDGSGPEITPGPSVAAPVPTAPADSVISLFSDVYTDIPVTTWSADWDVASLTDTTVDGNATKLYRGLTFAGIEFQADASQMTHFHMDLWTPDATAGGQVFKIKLVDFGADAAYGGGDDVEHELVLDNASTPAIASEQWVSLDIPLSDFSGLVTKSAVSQMILSGDLGTIWVDNVYFHAQAGSEEPTEPVVAAPVPTEEQKDVISLFADVYHNVPVGTWSADWDVADVEDVIIAGDTTKLYTNLSFAGIEFTSPTIDASAMEYFHIDIWTPDPVDGGQVFKLKLVDFGADGVWSGGGDDVEHELTFSSTTTPALKTGTWVSFDIPMTDFTGLVTTAHVSQMILSGDLSTLYIDNVYFYREPQVATPLVPAPVPTEPESDVVSVFSNVYTNVPVSSWSTDWDWASVEDVQISGDDVKKYTSTGFAGIEFSADATSMSHFHMDLWIPDSVADKVFKVKLVDFGNDGAYGGGDDVEHELSFTDASTPALKTGEWVSIDVPLAYFAGLTTKGHLSQMILSGDFGTFYVDNIYFYIGEAQIPEPEIPAPTPDRAATDVISLFSNAYTDVTVDTWSATWDDAQVSDVQISEDDVKLYTGLSFAGIEFSSSTVDASSMTHFHMDIWTPDSTALPAEFRIKLVDFGANGVWEENGDNVEHEIVLTASTTPALASNQWVSIDIPFSDFTGLTTRGHLAQLILSGDLNTVYVDNVYLYKVETALIGDLVPTNYALEQNYPNPFNPSTSIRFHLPESNHVTLTLYNMLGQEIMTLLNEYRNAGSYELTLDASFLPSGTYFYSITAGDFHSVKKMVLIK